MFLHTLHIYGAAGIAAFGWAVCRMLGWDATPHVPLWFCAALAIYNADRLRRDPADAVNVPLRAAASARLRRAGLVTFAISAATLVLLPLMRRDWITLALVLPGAVVCLNYSWPLLGFRFKDLPLLKSFFAPSIVTAAVIALPWLRAGGAVPWRTVAWCWCFLEFNMLLCDQRDIAGDRRCGIRSVPVVLGEKWTLLALAALLVAAAALAPAPFKMPVAIYLGALLFAARTPRSERFYEWWVEGMLFVPALTAAAATRP